MKLSELIRNYRRKNNLTIQEFADTAHLSKGYISQLENEYSFSKNGEKMIPSIPKLKLIAHALNMTLDDLFRTTDDMLVSFSDSPTRPSSIPVLGVVPCGEPIEAIEDIVDWIDVVPSQSKDHFGLIAKGDSMAPYILDGDILIVKQVPIVDSGKIAIVKVNGDDATCKKVLITDAGITLLPLNSTYEPRFISAGDCQQLPVSIVGEVVEIRRRFKK